MIERHTREVGRVTQRTEHRAWPCDERREIVFADCAVLKVEAKTETTKRFNVGDLVQQFTRPIP